VPYSFESFFLYSDLSTRFEVAESSYFVLRSMRCRGSCIFRCLLLSRDVFASFAPTLADELDSRAFGSLPSLNGSHPHPLGRGARSPCGARHPFGRTSFVLRRSSSTVSLSSYDGLTSSLVHLAMTEGRDDAEACSENCASPSRDFHRGVSNSYDHARLAAITIISAGTGLREHLSMPSAPCACQSQPTQPSTSYDVSDRPCRSGGHVSCSSFDDHVMLAFTVPALAFVLRRSLSHPRSGRDVVRSCERPSSLPLRVHAQFPPCGGHSARSPSRARVRVRLSTLTAGRTPSAHSPRAREIVSRFDGSQLRSSFGSRTVALCRTRPSRPCSSCDDHVRVAVRALRCMFTPCDAPIL
jgi:hypothetical protein